MADIKLIFMISHCLIEITYIPIAAFKFYIFKTLNKKEVKNTNSALSNLVSFLR